MKNTKQKRCICAICIFVFLSLVDDGGAAGLEILNCFQGCPRGRLGSTCGPPHIASLSLIPPQILLRRTPLSNSIIWTLYYISCKAKEGKHSGKLEEGTELGGGASDPLHCQQTQGPKHLGLTNLLQIQNLKKGGSSTWLTVVTWVSPPSSESSSPISSSSDPLKPLNTRRCCLPLPPTSTWSKKKKIRRGKSVLKNHLSKKGEKRVRKLYLLRLDYGPPGHCGYHRY